MTFAARTERSAAMTDRANRGRRSEFAGWVRFILIVAFGAWVLRNLIVAPFNIPSGSMLPTMRIGDYLFVTKWNYGYSRFSFMGEFPSFAGRVPDALPQRGDVVVFKRPDAEARDWVKRVIGLPGDTVAVRRGVLYLNGKEVTRADAGAIAIPVTPNSPCSTVSGTSADVVMVDGRAACRLPVVRETLPGGATYLTINQTPYSAGDNYAPKVVPAGHLFLMGDNRDDSSDSRFTVAEGGIGMVATDRVVGKATVIFWSTDGSADYANPISWLRALRWDRLLTSYNS